MLKGTWLPFPIEFMMNNNKMFDVNKAVQYLSPTHVAGFPASLLLQQFDVKLVYITMPIGQGRLGSAL